MYTEPYISDEEVEAIILINKPIEEYMAMEAIGEICLYEGRSYLGFLDVQSRGMLLLGKYFENKNTMSS